MVRSKVCTSFTVSRQAQIAGTIQAERVVVDGRLRPALLLSPVQTLPSDDDEAGDKLCDEISELTWLIIQTPAVLEIMREIMHDLWLDSRRQALLESIHNDVIDLDERARQR